MRFDRHCGDFVVRPFVAGDAPALHAAVRESMTSLSYWFAWCRPDYSPADAQARIAQCIDGWERGSEYPFGVFRADTLLGCAGLSRICRANRSANLGYWIGEPWRGQGTATRAASAVASIGFEALGLVRLEIAALVHNEASLRVAGKLGATREAEARNRLMFQGRPAPAVVYSLIPDDLTTDVAASADQM